MATREEIREGIAKFLFSMMHPLDNWDKAPESVKLGYLKRADALSLYLVGRDVVIKVDRELPNLEIVDGANLIGVSIATKALMLDAGYVAVEPLIEIGNEALLPR